MEDVKRRSMWRDRRLWSAILLVLALGAVFVAGVWFAGRGARSTAKTMDSYTAAYAGIDSPKDVAVLMPLYASDAVLRDVAADRTYTGTAEIESALDALLATPEFDLTIETTLIGNDWAIVKWTANGKNVSTDRLAQVGGATLLEFSKGKIERETWYYDPAKAPF